MIDWRHWHNEPYLVGGLVLLGWLWAILAGPLRARLAPGTPFPQRQAWAFYGSLLVFYLASGLGYVGIVDRLHTGGPPARTVLSIWAWFVLGLVIIIWTPLVFLVWLVTLPFDLTPAEPNPFNKCMVRVDPMITTLAFTDAGGVGYIDFVIQPILAMRGLPFFMQSMQLDSTNNAYGVSMTNDVRILLGDRSY